MTIRREDLPERVREFADEVVALAKAKGLHGRLSLDRSVEYGSPVFYLLLRVDDKETPTNG